MVSKGLAGLLAGTSCLLLTTLARAECKVDNDCTGELVCEQGACVAATAAPSPPAPDAPDAEPAEPPPAEPKWRRHSKGMMVGGIVMTSVGGISLFVSGLMAIGSVLCNTGWSSEQERAQKCDYTVAIYAPLGVGLGLIAAGVPTLIIGAKSEPVGQATLMPWVAPNAGGLSLRLAL